jgi:hypothetical protein
MCLFQLSVASSRFEIFLSLSRQELPSVALSAQEKLNFKISKLSTAIWGKKFNPLIWVFVYSKTNQPINQITE